MSDYGITPDGFVVKGIDEIISDSLDRARQAFGPTVDLTATSPLRKILEIKAAEDSELWKGMERLYYSNFLSTASGANLDLLGADLGVARQPLPLSGQVLFTLSGAQPGQTYRLPIGVPLITTASPILTFATLEAVAMAAGQLTARVDVVALHRGGTLPGLPGFVIDPKYLAANPRLNGITIAGKATAPFVGANMFESDDVYRGRMLGYPRNIWTIESVQQAAVEVDGVLDVLVSDSLGGVDVSQSYFNQFVFSHRLFSSQRQAGQPYFFDIVVAHDLSHDWDAVAVAVLAAVDAVRPAGIYANIIPADNIEVGFRGSVLATPGAAPDALIAAIKLQVASRLSGLKLGSDVLYSQVMSAIADLPPVVDVQGLRLRRLPATLGRVLFGTVPFQDVDIEADPGVNLPMGPREIAQFNIDSNLIQVEVQPA